MASVYNMKLKKKYLEYTTYWARYLYDPCHFCHKDFSTLRRLYAEEKFIFGLKCFKDDEYPEIVDENDDEALSSPVYVCKFGASACTSSMLCLGYEDGRIVLQQTTGPDKGKYVIIQSAHSNAIFDISWVPHKEQLITAVADASLCLWSLGSERLTAVQQFKGHLKAVKSVDVNAWDQNVFASGGKDCSAIVWDTRCQPTNKANVVQGAHFNHRTLNSPHTHRTHLMQNSIISLLFSQQHHLVTAGATDGKVKIWDLRKTYCHRRLEPQSLEVFEYSGCSSLKGFSSMCVSPHKDRIYVSCLDGTIYAYHLSSPSPKPVSEYYGHRPNTYYSKTCLSPCGSFLLSGSSDDKAYVWHCKSPGLPLASLSGHFDDVTSVAWSDQNLGVLVTCSDDMKHRFYKYYEGNNNLESETILRGTAIPYVNRAIRQDRERSDSPTRFTLSTPNYYRINFQTDNVSARKEIYQSIKLQPNVTMVTTLLTPSEGQKTSVRDQNTPASSGKKTLLSWLSSSKTPKDSLDSCTPSSLENKRASSKRKLTDLMDSNQENLRNEDKKLAVSPSKGILTEGNKDSQGPSLPGVAKMLTYEGTLVVPSVDTLPLEHSDDDKLFGDAKDKLSFRSKGYSNTPQRYQSHVADVLTPVKAVDLPSPTVSLMTSCLSPVLQSPTANLPNYVIDGRSPHDRRDIPVQPKKEADWLTALSLKKRNKFAEGMKRIEAKELKKSPASGKRKTIRK